MAAAADMALVASVVLGYAALPRPSRRLHGLPAVVDPLLAATRVAALPLFAFLRIAPVQRTVLRSYLGESDQVALADARMPHKAAEATGLGDTPGSR